MVLIEKDLPFVRTNSILDEDNEYVCDINKTRISGIIDLFQLFFHCFISKLNALYFNLLANLLPPYPFQIQ